MSHSHIGYGGYNIRRGGYHANNMEDRLVEVACMLEEVVVRVVIRLFFMLFWPVLKLKLLML